MFDLAQPLVDSSQRVAIALSTDPAWHDRYVEHVLEQFEAGDWSGAQLDQLADAVDGVTVGDDGVPHLDGKPVEGEAVRALAGLVAIYAMSRWNNFGEWPEGFSPGPVASVIIRPLTTAQRAVVEAQQGPRPVAGAALRGWLVVGDTCRFDLQVVAIEQGGESYDPGEFMAAVAAHSPGQADALRNEITMHLRRLWQEPVRLGKGCSVRSGSLSHPRTAAPRPLV